MNKSPDRAALLSVSDQSGLVELAKVLAERYILIATSGTARILKEAGIACKLVEEYTGHPEILDGRVKTLHPKIHSGLLAKRSNPSHMEQLKTYGGVAIDIAVINLYPFIDKQREFESGADIDLIEYIDVGGPTMIRAAAKNHAGVLPLIDPADYPEVIEALKSTETGDPFPLTMRRRLAGKVFQTLSEYDRHVASFLSQSAEVQDLPDAFIIRNSDKRSLRYGENPHQKAALYRKSLSPIMQSTLEWQQFGGKELSYNNLLDLDAAVGLLRDIVRVKRPTAAILKHLNPCGLASGDTLLDALQRAKRCDPRSHFGGIIVTNLPVDKNAAMEVREDFAEVILAPQYSEEAVEVLKTSKNLRIIAVNLGDAAQFEFSTSEFGLLVQERDLTIASAEQAELITPRRPTEEELKDLDLAWLAVKHVKSNAITLVRDGLLIGVGAGQMSRIDSVELALSKASKHGHLLDGAVAASDAFFPFPDSVEALASAGITCIIGPSGAKRDDEVVKVAEQKSISLLFAKTRHFKH